ncbi:hypothetical protein JTB14_016418 [Gonioctena quinquepunctata]|nr:hypothetical protein JTB14_016418 [Gonioctena quinquepunctata]
MDKVKLNKLNTAENETSDRELLPGDTPSIGEHNSSIEQVADTAQSKLTWKEAFAQSEQALLGHVNTSKDSSVKRNDMVSHIEKLQDIFDDVVNELVQHANERTVVASIGALEQIVTEIKATLSATPVINPEPPSMAYANALKKPPAQIRVNQGRPIKTFVNQVILIHPAPENNEIETAEDTLKAIKKVSPASVGVKPIKIINLPDEGIKIISADTNLNKAALDKLRLTAKVVDKGFPRIAITGVPENLTPQKVQDGINMDLALSEGDPEEVRGQNMGLVRGWLKHRLGRE